MSHPARRFTKTDWYGYAGCERFASGNEPLVAVLRAEGFPAVYDIPGDEVTEVEVVADSSGIFVAYGNQGQLFLDLADKSEQFIELVLNGLPEPLSPTVLRMLGFIEIGG